MDIVNEFFANHYFMVKMIELKIDHNDYLEPNKTMEVPLIMENLNSQIKKSRGVYLTSHTYEVFQ